MVRYAHISFDRAGRARGARFRMTGRRLERMRWHCRRGMLELDLILTRVLERDFDHFTPRELDLFEQLLAMEDTVLFDTLQGVALPTDPELKQLVEKIRT